ncbi:MAG: hypothetical protein Q4C70_09240, partial [Planctomycetia bacterium]|nr:hypothetical protein [Planctomycetia bacterium]
MKKIVFSVIFLTVFACVVAGMSDFIISPTSVVWAADNEDDFGGFGDDDDDDSAGEAGDDGDDSGFGGFGDDDDD